MLLSLKEHTETFDSMPGILLHNNDNDNHIVNADPDTFPLETELGKDWLVPGWNGLVPQSVEGMKNGSILKMRLV